MRFFGANRCKVSCRCFFPKGPSGCSAALKAGLACAGQEHALVEGRSPHSSDWLRGHGPDEIQLFQTPSH
jgi:hypothetical protein